MNKFRIWMHSIPFGEFETVKAQVIADCLITKDIWINWYLGRTQVQERYYPIIEKIAGKAIFTEE